MIYDALLHTPSQTFVIARPQGWTWTASERAAPFELVQTNDLIPAQTDVTLSLAASWGSLLVNASRLDSRLLLTSEI